MARAGLDRDKVLDAAEVIADAHGLDGLTWTGVAVALGVKPPSLYNHLGSLAELVDLLGRRGFARLDRIAAATLTATAGWPELGAFLHAWRGFAHAHPALHAATRRPVAARSAETSAIADALLARVLTFLARLGIAGDDALHAVRCLRAGVEGFLALEAGGGFGLPLEVDASFEELIAMLEAGLRRLSRPATCQTGEATL